MLEDYVFNPCVLNKKQYGRWGVMEGDVVDLMISLSAATQHKA